MTKFISKNLICGLLLVLAFSVAAMAAEDSDYVLLARERQYVGGLEESDLKVQLQLNPVEKNKNINNQEINSQESEEGF